VQAEGVLNARTKELILFSQVVLSRCEPCFKVHYRRARELGISPEELEEAAWCAVAMGGAPVRLFFLENLKGLSELKSCS
jgi:AhpD family alkylhydroperoxidase